MAAKSRKASDELALALALLQKEEEKIDKTDEPVISTPLKDAVVSILNVIIQYGRLRSFADEAQAWDGWTLDCPSENDGYDGVHTVRYQDKLWGARSETNKIVLAYQGKVWEFNLKAENLPGIVKAISTLPQLIRLWRAEVQQKKAELARRQAEWDAKRKQVEQELLKTEVELRALCRELIQASEEVLATLENTGETR